MKLRSLTLTAGLLLSTVSTVFAASTAAIDVTANVVSAASIEGMPTTLNFGDISPATLENNNIDYPAPVAVSIYDNNVGTGTQISTSCSKGDASGNGCYICTGASCTTATQALLTCTYTPCGGGSPVTITPGTTDNALNYAQTISATNSSPAACTSQAGSFTCSLNKTGVMNTSGAYSGSLNITVSDAGA